MHSYYLTCSYFMYPVFFAYLIIYLVLFSSIVGEGFPSITKGSPGPSHVCPMLDAWKILPSLRSHAGKSLSHLSIMEEGWRGTKHHLKQLVPGLSQRRLQRGPFLLSVEGSKAFRVAGLLPLQSKLPACLTGHLYLLEGFQDSAEGNPSLSWSFER